MESISHETTTKLRRAPLTNVACGECQRRKLKCSGRRPICDRCARENNPRTCVYDAASGVTRRLALKQKNEILSAQLRQHEHLVQILRDNDNEATIDVLSRLRDGQTIASIVDSETDTDGSPQNVPESNSSFSCTIPRARQPGHATTSDDMNWTSSASVHNTDNARNVPDYDKSTLVDNSLLCNVNHKSSMFSIDSSERATGEAYFHRAMLQLQEIRQKLQIDESQLRSNGSMPARLTASRLVNAYIQGTPALFLTWTSSQAETLIDSVYNEDFASSPFDLAEFFILIAGGADHDEGLVSEDEKAIYCASCISFFHASVDLEGLRTMRMMLCLILFLLSQKSRAAGNLLPGALYHGRLAIIKLRERKANLEQHNYWDSVLNSLHLIESWLNITSNDSNDLRAQGRPLTLPGLAIMLPNINRSIRIQASKVGSIALTLKQSFATEAFDKAKLLTISKDTLLNWHETLPDELMLTGFITGRNEEYTKQQKQGILMVHMMYLRVVIILQQQIISSAWLAQQNLPQEQYPLSTQTAACLNKRDSSSRRLAQVIGLMGIEGILSRRCWFTIDMCFSTACLMISASSQKLLFRHADGIEDDMRFINICITMLEYCSTVDELAMSHVCLLKPIFNDLQLLHEDCYLESKNSVDYILEGTQTSLEFQDYMVPSNTQFRREAVPVARSASKLLTNLFSKEYLVM